MVHPFAYGEYSNVWLHSRFQIAFGPEFGIDVKICLLPQLRQP